MSNHFSLNLNSGSSRRQYNKTSLFGFKVNKQQSWKDSVSTEYLPLVSGDCSDSDEELTIHDGTYLQVRQRGPTKSLSTTNLESDGKLDHNGEASKSDPFLQCEFLPLELKKDDTLHGIAVKYNCPISDLKRANNIISNQEFFALRELKIPVRKHGLLSEIIKDTQNSHCSWTEENGENCDTRTISIGIGPMLSSNPPQEAAEFLRKMDEDLVKIMLNTKTKKDSLEEAAAALSAPTIQPLIKDASFIGQSKISFPYVIACMLVVVVVIPIFIILYTFYNKPSSSHNDSLISSSNHELHYSTTKEDFSSKR